ncbi:hypothetical protein B0H11DRAFT_2294502 [Mycena galericulata]|nr:hypothetical protein B0H11DRAFT_2294502 [Mycena galericulata]
MQALSSHIDASGLSNDACPDVWRRVWKWIQFLDRYRLVLVDVNPLSDAESYPIYSSIILRLLDHTATRDVIYATPGVRIVMTRAWAIFLDSQGNSGVNFPSVCRFMAEAPLSSTNTTEILIGAGGRDVDLARLFVSHLRFVIPGPDYLASSETLVLLGGVIRFLKEVNHRDVDWREALFSEGIITPLVLTMLSVSVPTVDGANHMLDDCFIILVRLLVLTPHPRHLVDALKAGLLHAIVLSRSATDSVDYLLTAVIPPATVYYSVLKQIEEELERVEDLTQTSRFRASEIFQSWTKLVEFADTRLDVMRRYDNGERLSGSNCDNSACGKLMDRVKRKRCARCETSFYCSPECQKTDWADGHRKVCTRLRSLFLQDPEHVSKRDKSFLWAMAHRDYIIAKANLYVQRISVMNKYPGRPLFSVLDYTSGAVRASVRLFTSVGDVAPSFRTLWEENAARALRSGGRMHLLVLMVREGHEIRYRLLPMWSETSAIQDGIESIANSFPVGLELANSGYEAELAGKVSALLKQDGCDAKVTY